jgi:diguanylate cyclase (GGDEF)-like protein
MPLSLLPAQRLPMLAAALPLAGWAVHTSVLSVRLSAARRDPLTGLLTRDGFQRAASRVIARRNAVVLFVDLDYFKDINDVFGHACGDAALVHTARTLTAWAGPRAAVGRFGGDEFVAALTCRPEQLPGQLDELTADLRDAPHHGAPLPTTASIGAATVADLPLPSLPAALSAADAAVYAAKNAGRDRWTLAVPEQSHPSALRRWNRSRPALTLGESGR